MGGRGKVGCCFTVREIEVAESLSKEDTNQLGGVKPPARLLAMNKMALAGSKNWLLATLSSLEGLRLMVDGRERSVLLSSDRFEGVDGIPRFSESIKSLTGGGRINKESGTVPKCSLVGMSQKGTGFLNID